MGWRLREVPVTVKATKKIAQEFAEMEAAPHDRPLSERRLLVYRRLFAEGNFRPVTWAKATCPETGSTYRVNGKHTSIMLSELEVIPEFYVTIESYICETLEDVAQLYATFDSKMMSRTVHDINQSFAATVKELSGISSKIINNIVAGINFHLNAGVEGSKLQLQPADRAEVLLEHPSFALWLNNLLTIDGTNKDGRKFQHLLRMAVVGAMFGNWQKNVSDATKFWTAVRDEVGQTPDLPDRKLSRFLLTFNVDSVGGNGRIKTAKPREFYVRCIHAWNAWRKKQATDLRYFADKPIPEIK